MFCPNCGTQNPDNVKFCTGCGTPLQAADQGTVVLNQPQVPPTPQYQPQVPPAQPISSVPPVQQYQQSVPPTPQYQPPVTQGPQKPKNNKKTGLIIGGVVGAVVLIVAIVLIVVFAGGKDKDSDKSKDSEKSPKTTVSEVQDTEKEDETVSSEPTPDSSEQSLDERDKVAIAFLKSLNSCHFEDADKYSIIAPEKIVTITCSNLSVSESDFYEGFGQGVSASAGVNASIKNMGDIYSTLESVAASAGGGSSDTPVIDYDNVEKIDLSNEDGKDTVIQELIGCGFSLITEDNYSDYVNIDAITEAYEMEFEDGSVFMVVKYNGKWCAVATSLGMLFQVGSTY